MRTAAPSEQCPNCGTWVPLGDCHHSASGGVSIPGVGSYRSTLYGVCQNCAASANKYWDDMAKIAASDSAEGNES